MARQALVKTIEQMADEYQRERARLGLKWVKSRKRGQRAKNASITLRKLYKGDK